MCPDCGRSKMLFETEKKAQNFIKFNGNEIDTRGGELRPYYCPACCGYHISSKPKRDVKVSQTDRLIASFHRSVENGHIMELSKDEIRLQAYREADIIIRQIKELHPDSKPSITEVKEYVSDYIRAHKISIFPENEIRKKVYEVFPRQRHIKN